MTGDVLEEPGSREATGKHHHPRQQEDDIEVDRRKGFFLVQHAEGNDEQSGQERDEGSVEPLRRNERVGNEEDGTGDERVHGQREGPDRGMRSGRALVDGMRLVGSLIHPARRWPPPPATCARSPRSSSLADQSRANRTTPRPCTTDSVSTRLTGTS